MPQNVIRDPCRSFSRHLQLVIDSNKKHIEEIVFVPVACGQGMQVMRSMTKF